MYEKNVCTNSFNDDLKRLYGWSVKWKMSFNPDPTKPAEEVIFTKRNLTLYDPVSYSGVDVMQVDYHKHLGFILDSKTSYSKHIGKIGKANQGIGVIKRLYNYQGKPYYRFINLFIKRLMEFFNVTPNPIYGIHNPIYGIPNPIYGIHNPVGLKYLTRLRVGFSHLRAHKHQYNFSDTSSKYCSCRDNLPETVEHYLLRCPIYSLLRRELFGNLRLIVSLLTLTSSAYTCNLLLYGNPCYDFPTND